MAIRVLQQGGFTRLGPETTSGSRLDDQSWSSRRGRMAVRDDPRLAAARAGPLRPDDVARLTVRVRGAR